MDPPPGLAARTVQRVFRASSPEPWVPAPSGPWRLTDLSIAAGILMTISLILLPAINESRRSRSMIECKYNMRAIGVALASYSENHSGFLPFYSNSGPLGVAGIYAPLLLEYQFVTDRSMFFCPGARLCSRADVRDDATIPTLSELRHAQDQIGQLEKLLKFAGGSFGSLLGHMEQGKYQAPNVHRISGQSILVDRPRRADEGEIDIRNSNSQNHGGRGQNALCRDGSVRFFCEPRECPSCDEFFVNRDNRVEPGRTSDDAVFGTSETKISPQNTQF
jgi:hypothetical protein